MGEEAKIIFKCVVSEMPDSAKYLAPVTIKAILDVKPPRKPLFLTNRSWDLSVYKRYNVVY